MPSSARPTVVRAWSFTLAWVACGLTAVAAPSFPGIDSAKLDDAQKGRLLIEELNCVACHATPTAALNPRSAPKLAEAGQRIHPRYLESFIRDPHATKPGTSMPDLLANLPESERATATQEISHYLRSLTPATFAPQAPDAVAATQGEKLFHARGCAACHSPRDATGRETLAASSVPLGQLADKYDLRGLIGFLRQPHAVRPSGRMPDLRLPARELECIAHYLLRDTQVPGHLAYTMYRGEVWEGIGHEAVEPERAGQTEDFAPEHLGRIHHHMAVRFEGWLDLPTAGEYTFHLKANGATLTLDDQTIATLAPKDRRGVQAFEGKSTLRAGKHHLRLDYYHTGREPSLGFELTGPGLPRQTVPAAWLSVSEQPRAGYTTPPVDPALAARGKVRFGELGCVRCHGDVATPSTLAAPDLVHVDASKGCLSADGRPARFGLSALQTGWIRTALREGLDAPRTDVQTLHSELARLNCIACHERQGLGGVAPERNALFTSTAPALGDQGRLPPPLTDVGAKLTPAGLEGALLLGKRPRAYVDTAMPQFGEANIRRLFPLFEKVDRLESVTIPPVGDILESRNAGYEMIGEKGFSCIACHDFNGQKSGGAGALDLVDATTRVQKNWFHLYMRSPQRFHPGIIMPSYWPGGQSLRPDVLGGDATRQIDALWTYLEGGTQARNPIGLSRQSKEIRVTDVAEICRGRSSIGYRGIAVGYPSRISLAFDSEEMALRQLWRGEFANVDLGSFSPRAGEGLLTLPPGVPFHRLKSPEEKWPTKGKTTFGFPQDHGYQFRGYDLDAGRRPTFRYEYGEVKVEDRFEEVSQAPGPACFRRTLRFTSTGPTEPFLFRAASGGEACKMMEQTFRIDRLTVRLIATPTARLREGDLLIPVNLRDGVTELTLEYQW
jgi:mono/diheme cytochrome c family protein